MKSLVESLFDKDLATNEKPLEKYKRYINKYKESRDEFKKRLKQKGKVFVSGPDKYPVLYNGNDCIIYCTPEAYVPAIYVLSPKTIEIGEQYLEKFGSCTIDTRSKFFQMTHNYTLEYPKFLNRWTIPGIIIPPSHRTLDCPADISQEAKKIIDDFIK